MPLFVSFCFTSQHFAKLPVPHMVARPGAEPEDAGELLTVEKHADELTDQVAAPAEDAAQSDREKRLVTKLKAAREQLATMKTQAAERDARLAERDTQAIERDVRIAALKATAAKATIDRLGRSAPLRRVPRRGTDTRSAPGAICARARAARTTSWPRTSQKNQECPICCREAAFTFQVYVA